MPNPARISNTIPSRWRKTLTAISVAFGVPLANRGDLASEAAAFESDARGPPAMFGDGRRGTVRGVSTAVP